LSFLQFLALKYVLEEGPVRMKDIARFMSITPASATALVDGLVKMQVLERITDQHDRRIVLLRATQGGRKKLDDTENLAKRELQKIFEKLSEADRDTMITVLEKLSDILERQRPFSAAGRVA
jgi:DNA-binding MarR family transcriptional regulator